MRRLIAIVINILVAVGAGAQTAAFPYPEIPSTLASPSERGGYLLEHYWDNYDFADTLLIDKQDISEQGFANFIDLLPRMDSAAAAKGIAIFGERAFGKTAQRKVSDGFETMMEHYLDDPNSPMRNEKLFIAMLEGQIAAMEKDGFDTSRPKSRLANAKKNSPGTKAANFAFTTRQGERSSLWATEGKPMLLIFYDPACDHCTEILRLLSDNSSFRQKVVCGDLTVLAVYTEGNRQLWLNTCNSMPQEWTVAVDESDIVGHEIYNIPAMPIFYLLDEERKVVMKDPTLGELLSRLNQ